MCNRYTNLVTEKSQRNKPRESRGGLLADHMGLGKSLTMISLIVSNPAESKESVVFTTLGAIRRIKSTLIVVPYSCKWPPSEIGPQISHSCSIGNLGYSAKAVLSLMLREIG